MKKKPTATTTTTTTAAKRDVRKYTIELPRDLLDDIRLAAAELAKRTGKTVLTRSIFIAALEKWLNLYEQEKGSVQL